MITETAPQFYSTYDVARITGHDQSTIRRWIHQGRLPARRMLRKLMISREALTKFLESLPRVGGEGETDGTDGTTERESAKAGSKQGGPGPSRRAGAKRR